MIAHEIRNRKINGRYTEYTFGVFMEYCKDVQKFNDLDTYIAYSKRTFPEKHTESSVRKALTMIYAVMRETGEVDIDRMIALAGVSKLCFSKHFGIPYRTLQDRCFNTSPNARNKSFYMMLLHEATIQVMSEPDDAFFENFDEVSGDEGFLLPGSNFDTEK